MTGARYAAGATPPGPYSEHAVAAVIAHRDARIRELEAEVATLSRRLLAARDLEEDMRREIIDAYEQGRITTLDVLRLPHTQPEAELARQRETAYALGQRDAWMAVARAVGLEVTDCLSEGEIRKELARLREVEAAALAFVAVATDAPLLRCGVCDRMATRESPAGAHHCDHHADHGKYEDTPSAPAWRRLMKAVER